MSASLGKGLVIARVNSCPGKEADHAPGWVVENQTTATKGIPSGFVSSFEMFSVLSGSSK